MLKPFTEPLIPSPTWSGVDELPPIPAEIIEEENVYHVETILDSRRWGGLLEYLEE